MTSFRNKLVLITGGASGIGRLLGEQSLREGAETLILWDIDRHKLRQTKAEFSAMGFGRVQTAVVDISKPLEIEKAATRVLLEVGNVDILFNNAGIVVGKKFREHSAADIERTLAVNTAGMMHVTRVFLPDMMRQGSGHIINISSASAFLGNPRMSVYAASKWAVLGWSESLRLEMEREPGEVKVTTVCPSYIDTGMFEGVKAPMLFPWLRPDSITRKIIQAVKKNEVMVMAPDNIPLVPVLRSVLPVRVFDFLAEKLGVYHSMDEFHGKSRAAAADKQKVD